MAVTSKPTERRSEPAVERGEGETSDRTVTADEAFTLLRNERRRAVLDRLRVDPDTTLGDLANHVAAVENDTTPERVSAPARKRVYISLYQSHLPALADAGVVEYDRNRGDVHRLPAAGQLDRHLERLRESDETTPGWVRYAGVGVGLLATAGAVGLPPLGAVGPAWWAVVGVLALAALTAVRRR